MLAYAGKGRTRVQAINLNHVVRDSWSLLQTSLRTEGVLDFSPTQNLPAVIADPSQLRQVVMNLVINASEALPKRGGRITVRTGVRNLTREHFKKSLPLPGSAGWSLCVPQRDGQRARHD